MQKYIDGTLEKDSADIFTRMIEARVEPVSLQRYLSGDLTEDDFLRLVRRGLIDGVPAGTP